MRLVVYFLVCLCAPLGLAQNPATAESNPQSLSTFCTFADGKAIRLSYPSLAGKDLTHSMAQGHIWAPKGKPMILLTDTELATAGQTVKPGMYGMYIIPDKDKWTVVLSNHSETVGRYDKANDVARFEAEIFPLPNPAERLHVALVRRAPDQCNFRIYAGATAVFGQFEKHH